ncbi:MAG: cytochrome ubiquinol oxidase subunit I [Actinobacteria bacterium]|nr:cytochrome ubiquinol oxidase subunit I [Actinomycetota bacterium]
MTTAVLLSRVQFAFTIGYHFLYVPISLGLGLILVLAARRYRRSGMELDRAAADFWTKLFAATFAVGVASGLTMEFAFGTNWATYSRFVGNIFGAPLAVEGLFSFFIESTFLGIVLFGKRKVSTRMYYVSTWLVFGAAAFSAFWILVANSWMHTPAGYTVEGGRAVLTNIWAAIFTKSLAPRFVHTLNATFITGSFVAAAIAAHYLLKRKHQDFAKRALTTALIVGVLSSVAQPFIGHWHAIEVEADQPIKLAAWEAIYETQSHAPLSIYGWVDETGQRPVSIAIPDGLSLLLGLHPGKVIQGLNSVPASDRPPVQVLFQTWHLMIGVGILLALIMLGGIYLLMRKRLEYSLGYLKLLKYAMPLPILASILGWMTTEIGRQPWIVQGELRTADAVSSTVSAGEVATTLSIFVVIYTVLFFVWLRVVRAIVRHGPEVAPEAGPAEEGERLLASLRLKLTSVLGPSGPRRLDQIIKSRKGGDVSGGYHESGAGHSPDRGHASDGGARP